MSFEKKYNLRDLILQQVSPQVIYESEHCWIPMFHGTSSSVVNLTPAARLERIAASKCLIDYSFPLLQKYGVGKMLPAKQQEVFDSLAPLVVDAFVCARSMKNSSTWFEYDSVYTTFDPDNAFRYAKRASICGELGYIAHYLYLGLLCCDIERPKMTVAEESARDIILSAADSPSDPVVYMYIGIEKHRIRKENGQSLSWDRQIHLFLENIHHGNLRILGDFDITTGIPVDLASFPTLNKK